ncbi:hypothetical protein CTI12_AA266030 [Artemisia annua]|uniref:Uncharacterized protein n=1 Tax=Artemisia annua TaxID=35608 RepID=A0A2U1NGT1_ARTAN|nr:hypothetical protein CTI12_AA266030 [Artemisia annua]
MKDIDDFTKGCEDGTYSVWNELESDVRTMVMEAVCGLAEAFSVETIAKSTTTKPTHESPIVQVDSVYKKYKGGFVFMTVTYFVGKIIVAVIR